MWQKLTSVVLGLAVLVLSVGCNAQQDPSAVGSNPGTETKAAVAKKSDEHGHKPGSHGGIIVEIGRDNYHAEALFEKDGVLRLYTLGRDEVRIVEADSQQLTAHVKTEKDDGFRPEPVILEPVPQPGDSAGKTSQFVGKLPQDLWGKKVVVSIPNIVIAGERFRIPIFASAGSEHAEDMPPALADEDERKLFLTPAGKYTEADIKANGNKTPSQKYNGFKAAHDMKPKPGDKTCPVTMTRANPKCTWVVGGQTYEFCCPPCITEFVQGAKDKPDQVKEPSAYIKK